VEVLMPKLYARAHRHFLE
jgi:hypothetical protein